MRQSSVIWHECRSICGISFHDDLCSDFKVIQALRRHLCICSCKCTSSIIIMFVSPVLLQHFAVTIFGWDLLLDY